MTRIWQILTDLIGGNLCNPWIHCSYFIHGFSQIYTDSLGLSILDWGLALASLRLMNADDTDCADGRGLHLWKSV